MKLLTSDLKTKLPPLYATENNPDPIVVAKWFTPWTGWTWYATECSAVLDDDREIPLAEEASALAAGHTVTDYRCFGYVEGFVGELGYFSLREIASLRGPLGLRVERDLYWQPVPLSTVMNRCTSAEGAE